MSVNGITCHHQNRRVIHDNPLPKQHREVGAMVVAVYPRCNMLKRMCFVIVWAIISYASIELYRQTQLSDAQVKETSHVVSINKQNRNLRKPPVILLWTTFFGEKVWKPGLIGKGYTSKYCSSVCEFTFDKRRFSESSVVVSHVHQFRDKIAPFPRSRAPWQRFVLFMVESPIHITQDKIPDDMFNWTMTYARDSDIWVPYGMVYKHRRAPTRNEYLLSGVKRTRMVLWIVSRCDAQSKRHRYALQLGKHIQVDIYGNCSNKHCSHRQCSQLARLYKFYLAFENSICKDYITEKTFRTYSQGLIPIVLGGADYSKFLPPGSYIDIAKFESPVALANYLKKVSTNVQMYNSYFRWKSFYKIWNDSGFRVGFCNLCSKANRNNTVSRKTSRNLRSWWFTGTCKSPEQQYPRLSQIMNREDAQELKFRSQQSHSGNRKFSSL